MMRRRIAISVAALLFVSLFAFGGMAGAQSDRADACSSNSVLASLWNGINTALGIKTACSTTGTQNRTAPAATDRYIALGDSVAAGLGLANGSQVAGSDPACGTSAAAYPYLVARQMKRSVTDLACSGATAGDLFTEQHLSNTSRDIEPQLDRAFAASTPSLITITAGANDLRWEDFARKCYVSSCGTTFDQSAAAVLRVSVAGKLHWALQEIKNKSGGTPPRVVLTGYYHPLSTSCNFGADTITSTEAAWIDSQLDQLNQTIQSTVSNYSFARYAAVDFSGHELCTPNPWVQGMDAAAPLHPTARGQQAIAQAVLRQL